ncbi:MAG: thioredoxin family protein [Planctomycetes bacterium]|nr:thioredoxin family protein [Planctomycetota bacterium]
MIRQKLSIVMGSALVLCLGICAGQEAALDGFTEIIRIGTDSSAARLQPAKQGDIEGVVVRFRGSEKLHYYATSDSAPVPGFELKVISSSDQVAFDDPVFPAPHTIKDPLGDGQLDVFEGDFHVFVPFAGDKPNPATPLHIEVVVSGQGCTDTMCSRHQTRQLKLDFTPATAQWTILTAAEEPTPPASDNPLAGALMYLALAVAAGLSINLMPCVLPILPIVIMRLLENSQTSSAKRLSHGFSFCLGILLFFIGFAALTAILKVTVGTAYNLNDLYRIPAFSIVLFLVITVFGLIMLDVVPLVLPSAVANHQGSSAGLAGSVGTGFFAAVLSIPCSGALIGGVLAWAQTQPLAISSLSFVCMGIGMALPYAVIVSVPGFLDKMPKPGVWMDYFKKSCGFLLLFVAAKLGLAALPKDRLLNVLTYGVLLSFCVWMWGKWVTFSTPPVRKRMIRSIALVIALLGGLWLLPAADVPIEWERYDSAVIEAGQREGRPVLLKFTADWCSNCKVVDRKVFHVQRIVDLIKEKNVLAVKADTTAKNMPATQDLDQRYQGAGAIPLTILLVPGKPPARLLGTYPPSELSALLEALPAPESQKQLPVLQPISFTSSGTKLQTFADAAPERSDRASR